MELVRLDGREMTTRALAHDALTRALQLPDYYGRNLDALWDMVSTMEADVQLTYAEDMLSALGMYGQKLLALLEEADAKNPSFHFSLG